MYEIFDIRNGHAFPSVMALRTDPYKRIWEEDDTQDKEEAIKIFDYINFMCNPVKSNKFYGYVEDERDKHVKKQVWGDPDYPTSSDMMIGCLSYIDDMKTYSPTYETMEAARGALDALKKFFKTVDLTATLNSGALKYKPKDIQDSIDRLDKTVTNYETVRSKVIEELTNSGKMVNDREPGAYEE